MATNPIDIILTSSQFCEIFNRAIRDYHIFDDVNKEPEIFSNGPSLADQLYLKNWIDCVQWHLEDIIRNPQIAPEEALRIKRRIDLSNQNRTDLVEKIDQSLTSLWPLENLERNDIPFNTESPGWAIDRLSILQLKIYHMKELHESQVFGTDFYQETREKLSILLHQNQYLCLAIDQLFEELQQGKRKVIPYFQMKMYNDDRMNRYLKA